MIGLSAALTQTPPVSAAKQAAAAAGYRAEVEKCKKAAETNPRQAPAWTALGDAYSSLGHASSGDARGEAFRNAIASYEKSLNLSPNDAAVNLKAGDAYFNNEEPELAIRYFQKAVQADPKNAEALYRYGTVLLRSGSVDPDSGVQTFPPECKSSLQRYLQLQPAGTHVRQANAILQAMTQKVPKNYLPKPRWQDAPQLRIEAARAEEFVAKKVPPVYPLSAKEARIEGNVALELLISTDGEPHNMFVISSPSGFLSIAALEAVRQWRYRPIAQKDGEPVEIITSVVVKFSLAK